jgi:hypothetical protein
MHAKSTPDNQPGQPYVVGSKQGSWFCPIPSYQGGWQQAVTATPQRRVPHPQDTRLSTAAGSTEDPTRHLLSTYSAPSQHLLNTCHTFTPILG